MITADASQGVKSADLLRLLNEALRDGREVTGPVGVVHPSDVVTGLLNPRPNPIGESPFPAAITSAQ